MSNDSKLPRYKSKLPSHKLKLPSQNQSYQFTRVSTRLQDYAQYRLLTKDLPLVKGVSNFRSQTERRPSSRGDHCHTTRLLSQENSKKAHSGCHIYGIKWSACSQITFDGKGVHKTPCTHIFPCSLINLSWKSHPLLMFIARSVFQAHMHRCLLCHSHALCGFSENRLKLKEFLVWLWLRPLPPAELELIRGQVHLPHLCYKYLKRN